MTSSRSHTAIAFLSVGYRPFFLGAMLFAGSVMLVWLGVYVYQQPWLPDVLLPTYWHAHEMIFGYALAVIAGFLLTAIANWTGRPCIGGFPLLVLFGLWVAARLLAFADRPQLWAAAELAFALGLLMALLHPVIRSRRWLHLRIPGIVAALLCCNGVFHAGLLGRVGDGMGSGLYAGFYLLILLLFVMCRRVIPFFIQRGLAKKEGFEGQIWNALWLDRTLIGLFVAFALIKLVWKDQVELLGILALLQLLGHGWRLVRWHEKGIWNNSLLWSLYLGYACLSSGFAFELWVAIQGGSPFIPLHAFALGGVGLVTISMMARVARGHSGRDVLYPPRLLDLIIVLMLASFFSRVVAPLVWNQGYAYWIALSQGFWITAFFVLLGLYLPLLLKPRISN